MEKNAQWSTSLAFPLSLKVVDAKCVNSDSTYILHKENNYLKVKHPYKKKKHFEEKIFEIEIIVAWKLLTIEVFVLLSEKTK